MKFANISPCIVLILSGSLFSMEQSSENSCCPPLQGEPLTCGFTAGYNAPATIDLKDCYSFHYFADVSFTYWFAGEEGLALGTNGVLNTGTLFYPKNSTTVFQTFDYKPGFKVGAGMVGNHDWVLHAEYTWFRGKNVTNTGAAPTAESLTAGTTTTSGTPVWVVDDWFLQGSSSGQALAGSNIASTWKLAVDLVDLTVGRPFYQGPRTVISPFGGLRLALIRQTMNVALTEIVGQYTTLNPQPIGSRNTSHSWAIGPRFGADANALLCYGFRIESELAASLLYTQYTKVSHREDPASSAFNPGPYTASFTDYGCLRPIAEFGLGIGWGKYIWSNKYHIDFSADYDFAYFWNQNMMSKLLDHTLTGTSPASADLYYHGLTLSGRFDF